MGRGRGWDRGEGVREEGRGEGVSRRVEVEGKVKKSEKQAN